MMTNYHKKIVPYLDGTLSQDDKAEFEAFVLTHPEFESEIKTKQEELALLRSLIPQATLEAQALEGLKAELKSSVNNLLKVEPKNFWDGLKMKWLDWLNR